MVLPFISYVKGKFVVVLNSSFSWAIILFQISANEGFSIHSPDYVHTINRVGLSLRCSPN